MQTYDSIKNSATGLEWSQNGSMLGTITKDRVLTVFDPRKDGSAVSVSTHEGSRPQKLCWLGNSSTVLTAGFSKIAEREYAVWDLRDFTQPLIKKRLDDYGGIPFPFFDEDSQVLYIAGKGESAISYFQYNTESPNLIDFLHVFKGKDPQKGVSFMPKRVVDVISCEAARAVRLTGKQIEYVHFKVPRKSGNFQSDLFPPCRSSDPASNFEEYWSGVDKDPLRTEMRPDDPFNEEAHLARKTTLLSKLGDNKTATAVTVKAQSQPIAHNPEQQKEIDALTAKLAAL